MKFLRHPDAALLLMIQLTQLQWWFLHQDLLKHLKQTPPTHTHRSPPRNKLPRRPPSCFSWMPLWPPLDLTHDSNQSCLQLRSECVLRITERSAESWKNQKRAERHHMWRGCEIDTQHLESGVWGGGCWLPLLREVVRDSSGFGL